MDSMSSLTIAANADRCTNYYLSTLIVVGLVLIFLLYLFVYVVFAKTPPLVEGGKGVYRYGIFRPAASIGIFIILLLVFLIFTLKPSRTFVVSALIGTATPLPTITPTPT